MAMNAIAIEYGVQLSMQLLEMLQCLAYLLRVFSTEHNYCQPCDILVLLYL